MPQGEKAVRTDDYLSFWALGVLQKLRCPLAQTARGKAFQMQGRDVMHLVHRIMGTRPKLSLVLHHEGM